jgi:hypothetical protein
MKTPLTRRYILAALIAPASLFAADSAVIKAPLHATGDPDAAGLVLATLKEKTSNMIVQARNLTPAHSFEVEVAGIVEGTATTTKAGRLNVRFQTPPKKNVALLDFDPRGQTLRILDGGVSVLEGVISGSGEDDGIVVNERAELSRDDAPAKAKGSVTYNVTKKGKRTFRIDLSNLEDNPHRLLIDGVERGEIHRRGKAGVLVFDDSPSRDDVLPLNFDPRGLKVDVVTDDKFAFKGEVEAKARGVNVAAPSITGGNLPSTGADADGSAHPHRRRPRRHALAPAHGPHAYQRSHPHHRRPHGARHLARHLPLRTPRRPAHPHPRRQRGGEIEQRPSGVSSAESPADDLGILAKVHDTRDDDATAFYRVKDAVWETVDEKAAMRAVEDRRSLRERAELSESQVQVAHENLTPPRLHRLADFLGRLDVGIGRE